MRLCARILLLLAAAWPLISSGCTQRPSDDLFDRGAIELRLRLGLKEEKKLRSDPRHYVECALIENKSRTLQHVRVKLKGAAGSFRELDDRPAFTLSLKKADERFHGLTKFHLNNSVQDESYLNELVASQICAEAGCPTARVTHARVWLNDRDLGLYVLKEGYDEVFLGRHFADPTGNLYDGGFCQDIDADLEKDAGDGPDDRGDLKSLVAACREEDPRRRWSQIEERLDVEAFLNFTALELMLCHWDGYAQSHNNYRVYFRASDKRACFFPHGLDQILQDSNFAVFRVPDALVAHAVMENPAWSEKYRARVEQLLPLFAPEKLHARIDAGLARIRPMAMKIGPDFAQGLDDRAREFKERVNDRQERILHPAAPEPIAFNEAGWAQIEGWEPRNQEDAKLEEQVLAGRPCLLIEVGPSKQCTASFRSTVALAKGSYRLEAKVRTIDVTPIADEKGQGGAGVRLSGSARTNQAIDAADWQTVSHEFRIEDELAEVELIVELRASAGSAFFETSSLRLVKSN